MADTTNKTASPVTAPHAESQKERWVKYGANVALTILVAILLAGFLVYIAQRHAWRKDTTAAGAYSLKPQTVRLVETLPQKVKIVGLFSRAKQAQERKVIEDETSNPEVRYQQVADLLQEYQQKSGGKISVEMIDPILQPGKVEQLFNEVMQKYGNDINKYREVLEAYPKTLEQIKKISSEEKESLGKLMQSLQSLDDAKLERTVSDVAMTVGLFPQILDQIEVEKKKQLELKVPDWKGAADAIRNGLTNLTEMADAVLKRFKSGMEDAKTPAAVKAYMTASEPRFVALKKASDDLLKKMENLGQLKQLDELRQNRSNSIAVMAETDMKVLSSSQIFKAGNARMMDADGKVRPSFAGEQQISTALVSLTSKEKKKVAFIRGGGPPLVGRIMNYEGPLTEVGERLREYNIEIVEKDLSGQWAMQAMQLQMQGMPIPPEPQDDQLKDAVWIVSVTPQDPRAMMQNPNAGQLGPKVQEHLKNGGSAMLMFDPQVDKMDFLKEWGIEVRSDYLLVHEKIDPQGARAEDRTEDWKRQQPVFEIKDLGDHLITRPLRSLGTLLVPLVPVNTVEAKGVKTARILPVPTDPRPWGESDFDQVRQGKRVEFNKKTDDKEGDLPAPLWGGAAAENDKGQRVVAIGSRTFAFNDYVQEPDMEIFRTQRRLVARFPGNAELFVNSVFWLTKMDTMIAISPSALEVARIAPMSDGVLSFWRIWVLIIGLPTLVLLAGTFVWLKRRD